MLRTVLAVLLASALLAVSLSVIDSARITHAETQVETALDRLDTAATLLRDSNEPVHMGQPGARRYHTLRLPVESLGSAGIDALRFRPPDTDKPPSWRVDGGNWTAVHTSTRLVGPPDELTLQDGGRQEVVLTLREHESRAVVVVSRP